jgi:hypothetical protein
MTELKVDDFVVGEIYACNVNLQEDGKLIFAAGKPYKCVKKEREDKAKHMAAFLECEGGGSFPVKGWACRFQPVASGKVTSRNLDVVLTEIYDAHKVGPVPPKLLEEFQKLTDRKQPSFMC